MDSSTGFRVDAATGYYIHPRTGFLIDPTTGRMMVRGSLADTGFIYSFTSGNVLDAPHTEAAETTSTTPTSSSAAPSPSVEEVASEQGAAPPRATAVPSPTVAASLGVESERTAAPADPINPQPLIHLALAIAVVGAGIWYYFKVFRSGRTPTKPDTARDEVMEL